MGLLSFLSSKTSGLNPKNGVKKRKTRGFQGASAGRLTNDWKPLNNTLDSDLLSGLRTLRTRSRDLSINNDYARRFFKTLVTNVIGHKGIILKAKSKTDQGVLDRNDNSTIERAWKQWGKQINCSVDGSLSWRDAQCLVIETLARDGEILIRLVEGFQNDFRFSLQFIESDHLDETYNDSRGGKNIKMGIERDHWNRPIAYHLLTHHPGELGRSKRERVPANQILHLFIKERPTQARGFPWLSSAMYGMKLLDGYRIAELTSARVSASKMGFFVSPDGEGYDGDDTEDDFTPIMNAEPGTFEQLPEGMTLETFDPSHPNSAYESFEKAILRGIASGLNISYTTLANDLEGVSYSSIRQGALEDRENWRVLQNFIIEHLCTPVYERWLKMFLTLPDTNLPPRKFDKFLAVDFMPKGFPWIDPLKEIKANTQAVESRFKSKQDVLAETGRDFEEVLDEISAEIELEKSKGLITEEET